MERASNRAGRIGTEWNMNANEAPSVVTVLHIAPESLVHVLCGFPVPDPAQLCSPFSCIFLTHPVLALVIAQTIAQEIGTARSVRSIRCFKFCMKNRIGRTTVKELG